MSVRTRLPLRIATLLLPYRGRQCPKVEFAADSSGATVRIGDKDEYRIQTTLR